MPIDIVRAYDSTDSGIHEFGQSWSLTLSGARLQRNRNIGLGWTETVSQSAFPTFCLLSNSDRFVTITFPDSRTYKFRAVASPECDLINPITAPTLGFQQVPHRLSDSRGHTHAGGWCVHCGGWSRARSGEYC